MPNYSQTVVLWKDNKSDIGKLFDELHNTLDAEKERRFGENQTISDMRLDGRFRRATTLPNGDQEVFRAGNIEDAMQKNNREQLKGFEEKRNVRKAAILSKSGWMSMRRIVN